jgi:hypothetical protein
MKRRLLALALVLPVLGPASLVSLASRGEHECRDHVCMCARSCPPRRDAPGACHGGEAARPGLRGACNHDEPQASAKAMPAVLTDAGLHARGAVFSDAVSPAVPAPTTGFTRLDSQPPRHL